MNVLVFAEDGSSFATDVLANVFWSGARLVAQGGLRRELFVFTRVERSASRACMWLAKGGPAARDRDDMCRQIAEHIVQGPDRFILFHFDADCRWSERAAFEREALFERQVVLRVSRLPRDPKEPQGEQIGLDLVRDRTILVVPFWCLESWLYAGSPVAATELVAGEFGYDDVDFPVDRCSLRRRNNLQLSRQVDGGSLRQFSPSFAQFVARIESKSDLVALLRRRCWQGQDLT